MKINNLTAATLGVWFIILLALAGFISGWPHREKPWPSYMMGSTVIQYEGGPASCSDDGKTWWPARIEGAGITCYAADKPR